MRRTTSKFRIGLVLPLACALVTGVLQQDRYDDDRDSYVFATTRGLNELDVHPAFKLPAWPLAFVLGLVFLPFAALADAMNQGRQNGGSSMPTRKVIGGALVALTAVAAGCFVDGRYGYRRSRDYQRDSAWGGRGARSVPVYEEYQRFARCGR
jgi:hypothetical protein